MRPGLYADSVALMVASREAALLAGVESAALVMGTPLNVGLLADAGFLLPDPAPGPDDLVIAVSASSADALDGALREIDRRLAERGAEPHAGESVPEPRSWRSARRSSPSANVALVSVPGPYAEYEAAEALEAGLHVMCFSNGVPVEAERRLKERALARDLLFMGPDCGTAILDGVGLGFANAVRHGPVGIVGASGTGIQEIACLLDAAGVGVSQAIGVGGRDLQHEVGGLMTLRALDLLAEDAETRVVVVVSKPTDDAVAARVLDRAARLGKPVVPCLLGSGATLAGAATEAARLAGADAAVGAAAPTPLAEPRVVAGLFSGGTLLEEARAVLADPLLTLRLVDLGADDLTAGRPHPMIDNRLRVERIGDAAGDSTVDALLLDVVLGQAAHPDPAGDLAPAIAEAIRGRAGRLTVAVGVTGTAGDPQGLGGQLAELQRAGALVARGTAAAAARLTEAIA